MDVAGEREQPGLRDHLDGLLSHSPGRRLQIQRAEYRDDKDVVLAAGPLGHQGLAHRGGVPVKEGGHAGPVHRAVGVGVVVWSVRHPFLV